jgi:glutamine synthetase type III
MAQYAILGPGQVTSSQGLILLGAARYPSQNAQFPNVIGAQFESTLVKSYNEVLACSVSPSSAYNTAFNAPAVNAPPSIWIPQNIAFYPYEIYNFGQV